MKKKDKERLKKYQKYLEQEAKKFKLTAEDLGNLYDLSYFVNWQDYKTLKLNKMDKWFEKFFEKIEKIVVPELYEDEKQNPRNERKNEER